jgi:hypothetical protein
MWLCRKNAVDSAGSQRLKGEGYSHGLGLVFGFDVLFLDLGSSSAISARGWKLAMATSLRSHKEAGWAEELRWSRGGGEPRGVAAGSSSSCCPASPPPPISHPLTPPRPTRPPRTPLHRPARPRPSLCDRGHAGASHTVQISHGSN